MWKTLNPILVWTQVLKQETWENTWRLLIVAKVISKFYGGRAKLPPSNCVITSTLWKTLSKITNVKHMKGCSPKAQSGRSLMYIKSLKRISAQIMHVRKSVSERLYKKKEFHQKNPSSLPAPQEFHCIYGSSQRNRRRLRRTHLMNRVTNRLGI